MDGRVVLPLVVSVLLSLHSPCWAKTVPAVQKRSSECFGSLGCFSNSAPFFSAYRPLSFMPESPDDINPTITLFSRQAPGVGHVIKAGDDHALNVSTFTASRPTKIIVHGFIDNGGTGWMTEMKNEFLQHGDYNILLVDWGSGSLALYGQATANTRVVGAMIAELLKFMQTQADLIFEDVHIIGHSLGAHVAGYAGERLRSLGRITGLDPAEPYFQNTDKVVRLDPSDALFVDVIHTDGDSFYSTDMGFGMMQACGHVDYYPNGGHDQPGCEKGAISHLTSEGLFEGTKEFVACNHLRSYHFFIESINSACPFEGYRCDSEDHFNSGDCVPCSGQSCGYMGLNADRVKPAAGTSHVKYYLKTGDSSPYCRYHYRVAITFAGAQTNPHEERGQIFVQLTGNSGQSHNAQLSESNVYLQPGHTYTYTLTSPRALGDVESVSFHWIHSSEVLNVGSWNIFGLRHPSLFIDKVEVLEGENNRKFTFCEHATSVETGNTKIFSTQC